jgi:hypothetical protein
MSKHIMELVASLVDDAKVAGIKAERERIIKIIEDSVGKMTAEVIIERIKEGTK